MSGVPYLGWRGIEHDRLTERDHSYIMRIGVRQTEATTTSIPPATIMWCGVRASRRKVLTDGIDERLQSLRSEVCQQLHAQREELEVMPDHIHLSVER
jgi:hypothetical protein